MASQQPYRMIVRQVIWSLPPGAEYPLRFNQVGDVFSPGMVGDNIHPNTWRDLHEFAADVGCLVRKDDKRKAFVFRKPIRALGG